jgi:hypothetical protein
VLILVRIRPLCTSLACDAGNLTHRHSNSTGRHSAASATGQRFSALAITRPQPCEIGAAGTHRHGDRGHPAAFDTVCHSANSRLAGCCVARNPKGLVCLREDAAGDAGTESACADCNSDCSRGRSSGSGSSSGGGGGRIAIRRSIASGEAAIQGTVTHCPHAGNRRAMPPRRYAPASHPLSWSYVSHTLLWQRLVWTLARRIVQCSRTRTCSRLHPTQSQPLPLLPSSIAPSAVLRVSRVQFLSSLPPHWSGTNPSWVGPWKIGVGPWGRRLWMGMHPRDCSPLRRTLNPPTCAGWARYVFVPLCDRISHVLICVVLCLQQAAYTNFASGATFASPMFAAAAPVYSSQRSYISSVRFPLPPSLPYQFVCRVVHRIGLDRRRWLGSLNTFRSSVRKSLSMTRHWAKYARISFSLLVCLWS